MSPNSCVKSALHTKCKHYMYFCWFLMWADRSHMLYDTIVQQKKENFNRKVADSQPNGIILHSQNTGPHGDSRLQLANVICQILLNKQEKYVNNYLLPAILELCTYGKSIALPNRELIQWASFCFCYYCFFLQKKKPNSLHKNRTELIKSGMKFRSNRYVLLYFISARLKTRNCNTKYSTE